MCADDCCAAAVADAKSKDDDDVSSKKTQTAADAVATTLIGGLLTYADGMHATARGKGASPRCRVTASVLSRACSLLQHARVGLDSK